MDLKPRELLLLAVLTEHEDRWGDIKLTMEELSELTGFSRTTLWRHLSTLSERGLIETTRTKRNLGRLYKNKYKLIKIETSTASPSNSIDKLTKVTVTTEVLNTSYLIGPAGPEEEETMVNRWSEDDDVAGFGLLEGPVPEPKVSKKDPKTRFQRPKEDWTAMDVASEFSSRVYAKVRGIPGMVNTMGLRGALASNRTKYGVTAEVELALIDKFFADGRNLNAIKRTPKGTVGIFLNFVTNNIQKVQAMPTIAEAIDTAESIDYIVASDGRKFDKSIAGRAALERYEARIAKG